MILTIVLLIIGLAILIAGAEILVCGSASAARRFGISPLVIGLTVVAFGTSMPELIVNVFSAVRGTTDMAIGNIVGSNIANILLILGVSTTITVLSVKKSTVWREIPFALLAVVLLYIMGNDKLIDGAGQSVLTRTDGLVLIGVLIVFMFYIFGIAKAEGESAETIRFYRTSVSFLLILGGLLALLGGGKVLVDQAIELARMLGTSERIIGLTVVAVGTSLPELATSVIAALHKHHDIAVGNVVGSNIFNVFWILGLTSLIRPLPFSGQVSIDCGVAIAATLLLFFAMFIGRKHQLERWQGIAFLLMYIGYISWLVTAG